MFFKVISGMANNVDQDQTSPSGFSKFSFVSGLYMAFISQKLLILFLPKSSSDRDMQVVLLECMLMCQILFYSPYYFILISKNLF